jgi:hypothetical protein
MIFSVKSQASATKSQKPVIFSTAYGFLGFEWCNHSNDTNG